MEASPLYERRGRLFEESVSVLRLLLHEDKVTVDGEFYRFTEVTLGAARPSVPPPIIMAGGNYYPQAPGGPVHHEWQEQRAGRYQLGPYQRIARLGDGWITPHATPQEYAAAVAKISAERTGSSAGEPFTWAYNVFVNVGDDPKQAWLELRNHLESFHGRRSATTSFTGGDMRAAGGGGRPPERIRRSGRSAVPAGDRLP